MADFGILVVGHGTRRSTGQQQFLDLVQGIVQHAGQATGEPRAPGISNTAPAPPSQVIDQRTEGVAVEGAFLELASPPIEDAMERLVRRGVRRLGVVPVLLFAAGHARHDIPTLVAKHAQRLGIDVCGFAQPLELDPAGIDVSIDRCREAISLCQRDGRKGVETGGLAVLFVGRGSSDRAATDAFRRWCRRRAAAQGIQDWQCAFLHGASPNLAEGLRWLDRGDWPLRILQPHLLFDGQLMDCLREEVSIRQSSEVGESWGLARELGPDARIAAAFAQKAMKLAQPEQRFTRRGSMTLE
ncbi:MAG: hypothetical protein D6753_12080 [Planctomycetota bacterium]|nr:MAG: hypothetical protein D6753_12080 [Planctomycetota bacterium]